MKDLLFNNKFTCVAVSKTKPIEDIEKIYNLGHKDFGENKAQELIGKHQKLPKDIRWHMIGHLQTNKVKKVVPISYLIHSVDSLKLIKTIDKESKKLNKTTTQCTLGALASNFQTVQPIELCKGLNETPRQGHQLVNFCLWK